MMFRFLTFAQPSVGRTILLFWMDRIETAGSFTLFVCLVIAKPGASRMIPKSSRTSTRVTMWTSSI